MKYRKIIAVILVVAAMMAICLPASASSNDFRLQESASGYLDGSKVTSSFNSRVTGGGGITGYRVRFEGSANGKWAKGQKCQISRTMSFKMTGLGGLSISGGNSGVEAGFSVTGSSVSDTMSSQAKSFNWDYDLTMKRWNICWVTQSLYVSYTYQKNGNDYSKSINCSDDRVFW